MDSPDSVVDPKTGLLSKVKKATSSFRNAGKTVMQKMSLSPRLSPKTSHASPRLWSRTSSHNERDGSRTPVGRDSTDASPERERGTPRDGSTTPQTPGASGDLSQHSVDLTLPPRTSWRGRKRSSSAASPSTSTSALSEELPAKSPTAKSPTGRSSRGEWASSPTGKELNAAQLADALASTASSKPESPSQKPAPHMVGDDAVPEYLPTLASPSKSSEHLTRGLLVGPDADEEKYEDAQSHPILRTITEGVSFREEPYVAAESETATIAPATASTSLGVSATDVAFPSEGESSILDSSQLLAARFPLSVSLSEGIGAVLVANEGQGGEVEEKAIDFTGLVEENGGKEVTEDVTGVAVAEENGKHEVGLRDMKAEETPGNERLADESSMSQSANLSSRAEAGSFVSQEELSGSFTDTWSVEANQSFNESLEDAKSEPIRLMSGVDVPRAVPVAAGGVLGQSDAERVQVEQVDQQIDQKVDQNVDQLEASAKLPVSQEDAERTGGDVDPNKQGTELSQGEEMPPANGEVEHSPLGDVWTVVDAKQLSAIKALEASKKEASTDPPQEDPAMATSGEGAETVAAETTNFAPNADDILVNVTPRSGVMERRLSGETPADEDGFFTPATSLGVLDSSLALGILHSKSRSLLLEEEEGEGEGETENSARIGESSPAETYLVPNEGQLAEAGEALGTVTGVQADSEKTDSGEAQEPETSFGDAASERVSSSESPLASAEIAVAESRTPETSWEDEASQFVTAPLEQTLGSEPPLGKPRVAEIFSVEELNRDTSWHEEMPSAAVTITEVPGEEALVEDVPVEEVPVENVSVEEAPVEEMSAEEVPVEEVPVEEVPVKVVPVEEAPVEEVHVEEVHVEEVPVEEMPVEEVPVEEVLAEEMPVEEVPAEEVPVEEVPVEEVPVEEVPAREATGAETSVEAVPVEETSLESAPVEEAPVEETPVEDAPLKDEPIEDSPVEEVHVEETLVEDAPVEEMPVEDAPLEDAPVEDAPCEEAPVEETPDDLVTVEEMPEASVHVAPSEEVPVKEALVEEAAKSEVEDTAKEMEVPIEVSPPKQPSEEASEEVTAGEEVSVNEPASEEGFKKQVSDEGDADEVGTGEVALVEEGLVGGATAEEAVEEKPANEWAPEDGASSPALAWKGHVESGSVATEQEDETPLLTTGDLAAGENEGAKKEIGEEEAKEEEGKEVEEENKGEEKEEETQVVDAQFETAKEIPMEELSVKETEELEKVAAEEAKEEVEAVDEAIEKAKEAIEEAKELALEEGVLAASEEEELAGGSATQCSRDIHFDEPAPLPVEAGKEIPWKPTEETAELKADEEEIPFEEAPVESPKEVSLEDLSVEESEQLEKVAVEEAKEEVEAADEAIEKAKEAIEEAKEIAVEEGVLEEITTGGGEEEETEEQVETTKEIPMEELSVEETEESEKVAVEEAKEEVEAVDEATEKAKEAIEEAEEEELVGDGATQHSRDIHFDELAPLPVESGKEIPWKPTEESAEEKAYEEVSPLEESPVESSMEVSLEDLSVEETEQLEKVAVKEAKEEVEAADEAIEKAKEAIEEAKEIAVEEGVLEEITPEGREGKEEEKEEEKVEEMEEEIPFRVESTRAIPAEESSVEETEQSEKAFDKETKEEEESVEEALENANKSIEDATAIASDGGVLEEETNEGGTVSEDIVAGSEMGAGSGLVEEAAEEASSLDAEVGEVKPDYLRNDRGGDRIGFEGEEVQSEGAHVAARFEEASGVLEEGGASEEAVLTERELEPPPIHPRSTEEESGSDPTRMAAVGKAKEVLLRVDAAMAEVLEQEEALNGAEEARGMAETEQTFEQGAAVEEAKTGLEYEAPPIHPRSTEESSDSDPTRIAALEEAKEVLLRVDASMAEVLEQEEALNEADEAGAMAETEQTLAQEAAVEEAKAVLFRVEAAITDVIQNNEAEEEKSLDLLASSGERSAHSKGNGTHVEAKERAFDASLTSALGVESEGGGYGQRQAVESESGTDAIEKNEAITGGGEVSREEATTDVSHEELPIGEQQVSEEGQVSGKGELGGEESALAGETEEADHQAWEERALEEASEEVATDNGKEEAEEGLPEDARAMGLSMDEMDVLFEHAALQQAKADTSVDASLDPSVNYSTNPPVDASVEAVEQSANESKDKESLGVPEMSLGQARAVSLQQWEAEKDETATPDAPVVVDTSAVSATPPLAAAREVSLQQWDTENVENRPVMNTPVVNSREFSLPSQVPEASAEAPPLISFIPSLNLEHRLQPRTAANRVATPARTTSMPVMKPKSGHSFFLIAGIPAEEDEEEEAQLAKVPEIVHPSKALTGSGEGGGVPFAGRVAEDGQEVFLVADSAENAQGDEGNPLLTEPEEEGKEAHLVPRFSEKTGEVLLVEEASRGFHQVPLMRVSSEVLAEALEGPGSAPVSFGQADEGKGQLSGVEKKAKSNEEEVPDEPSSSEIDETREAAEVPFVEKSDTEKDIKDERDFNVPAKDSRNDLREDAERLSEGVTNVIIGEQPLAEGERETKGALLKRHPSVAVEMVSLEDDEDAGSRRTSLEKAAEAELERSPRAIEALIENSTDEKKTHRVLWSPEMGAEPIVVVVKEGGVVEPVGEVASDMSSGSSLFPLGASQSDLLVEGRREKSNNEDRLPATSASLSSPDSAQKTEVDLSEVQSEPRRKAESEAESEVETFPKSESKREMEEVSLEPPVDEMRPESIHPETSAPASGKEEEPPLKLGSAESLTALGKLLTQPQSDDAKETLNPLTAVHDKIQEANHVDEAHPVGESDSPPVTTPGETHPIHPTGVATPVTHPSDAISPVVHSSHPTDVAAPVVPPTHSIDIAKPDAHQAHPREIVAEVQPQMLDTIESARVAESQSQPASHGIVTKKDEISSETKEGKKSIPAAHAGGKQAEEEEEDDELTGKNHLLAPSNPGCGEAIAKAMAMLLSLCAPKGTKP